MGKGGTYPFRGAGSVGETEGEEAAPVILLVVCDCGIETEDEQ